MATGDQVLTSRRAVLAAGVGGLTALFAAALGHPTLVDGADGEPVLVGQEATAVAGTKITAMDQYASAIWGHAPSGNGVLGTGSDAAVIGRGGNTGVAGTGVFYGVTGSTLDNVSGVTGVGGHFTSEVGYALRTRGRVQFDKVSGVALVSKGQKKVTVTPGVDISPGSKLLTSLQSTAGGTTVVHRISRDMDANSFSIYLTANATVNCYVAWLVIG
jgi:hypothetical protein